MDPWATNFAGRTLMRGDAQAVAGTVTQTSILTINSPALPRRSLYFDVGASTYKTGAGGPSQVRY